jgi:hypothetical protein
MTFAAALFEQLDRVGGRVEPVGRLGSAPRTTRGARERLRYITSAKTGVPVADAARLLKVSPATLRTWLGGGSQGPAAKARIDQAYEDLLKANNRPKSRSKAALVLRAVSGNALNLLNSEGDDRYYALRRRWDRLVALWSEGDISGADDYWDSVVADWDYGEPWVSIRIIAVDIV